MAVRRKKFASLVAYHLQERQLKIDLPNDVAKLMREHGWTVHAGSADEGPYILVALKEDK